MSGEVDPSEALGRCVLSSSQAKKAARGDPPPDVFLERVGVANLSVDRLSKAPHAEAVKNGENVARLRSTDGHNRTFYGWLVVSAADAEQQGRRVVPTPLKENPYHADIKLPDLDEESREEHAFALSIVSKWQDKLNPSAK